MARNKGTFFDTFGPDAPATFRTAGFAAGMSVLGSVIGALIGIQRGMGFPDILVPAAIAGVIAGIAAYTITRMIPQAAGSALQSALMPTGNTTPYETDFSYEQALAMRGDVKGALASFEEKISAAPHDAAVRLIAAEMYMSSGNATRARDLFREVQRIPAVQRRDDVLASYRLIDLYRGKLEDSGRALPELRRLIERYPDTQIATQAREVLARLKNEMPPGEV